MKMLFEQRPEGGHGACEWLIQAMTWSDFPLTRDTLATLLA